MTATTGKSRITEALRQRNESGRPALIPYLTVGYPEIDSVQRVAPAMVEAGVTIIELGVPFSDPLADGVTVQQASHRALENGVNMQVCLSTARDLRKAGVDVPLIFMGYYNPMLSFGLDRFAASCADAGVDGFIVPDLPVEESDEFVEACRKHGLDLIFMLAPTSTDDLIARVARQASGFIYCVSLTGVTGARSSLSEGLPGFLARVRRHTDLPLAIGFGISEPEHVAEAAKLAEGVAVGSAMINRLSSADRDRQPEEMAGFVRYLLGE